MRVLAITQRLDQPAADRAKIRRIDLELVGEPVGDRGIVGGGAGIGLGGEAAAQRPRGRATVGGELVEHALVVGGFDDDGDIVMVLRGGADHRRAADVDVLDAVVIGLAGGDRRLERVEVDDEQVDRRDAMAEHRGLVLGMRADGEQAAMHLGMQRLDAAVHHLREAGQLRHVLDLEAGRGNRLGGASGRH